MTNRRLTDRELAEIFEPLLHDVRTRIAELASGDQALLWALRRKLAKELQYDERGKPMRRKLLKAKKRGQQGSKCAVCGGELPGRGAVLDRLDAMQGYTDENTRLLCPGCDQSEQERRGYA